MAEQKAPFEETLKWAQDYKVEPVVTFSGPMILLLVAAALIVLLLVWWIVMIFSSNKEVGGQDESTTEESVGEGEEGD